MESNYFKKQLDQNDAFALKHLLLLVRESVLNFVFI